MEFASRAAYRGQLTKIVKAAADYLSSNESQLDDESEYDAIEEELNTYLQRLRAVNDSLITVNRRIIEKDLVKTDLEQEMTKTAEYEDSAITILTRLESRLKRLLEKSHPQAVTVNAEPNSRQRSTQSQIKLPKLTLKKYKRLGAAKKVIGGFTASENCYDAAISLLKEQYGDVERLIDNHIQQLVSLRPVHSCSDVHSLRSLYNSITTCRRSLTALNVPSHEYDVMLKSILLRCLPAELRIDFHRIKEREEDSCSAEKEEDAPQKGTSLSDSTTTTAKRQMHNLLEFLKNEIEAMERSRLSGSQTHNTRGSSTSTAASLVALNENDRCLFCNSSSHNIKDCDSNLSISQKRDILAKNGSCFRCTKKGHSSKKCRSAKYIKCSKCKGNHITTMCDPKFQKSSSLAVMIDKETSQSKEEESVSSSLMCNSYGAYANVFLKTARCIAEGKRQKENLLLRIVIDAGSQNTYICAKVAKRLELIEIGKIKMTVLPFGTTSNSPQKTLTKVLIRLRSQYDYRPVEIEALVVPQICVDLLDAPNENCGSFSNFRLADKIYAQNVAAENGLSMLIGADYYWDVVTGKQKRISGHLRAVETLFGWTMQGRHEHSASENPGNGSTFFVSKFLSMEGEQCTENLSAMWALETIGIQGEEKEKVSLTETLTQRCIQQCGCRYQASLPWKDDGSVLCGDRTQAIARVDSLVRRLSRDPKKLEEYDAAVQTLVKEGIAEPVGSEKSKRTFYLPHHPIYKDSETTRLRIVFDASIHKEGHPSLNSFLMTGTNLLTDVQQILLNFRMGPFALVADIEKAFLQILLAHEDRDSHRFVWLSSINNRVYQDFRMTRVTFGVNCSPFLLSATIQHHLQKNENEYPETCRLLKSSFYMDDLVLSFHTEEEGQKIYQESTDIMKSASMTLRKWHSNSIKVRNLFEFEENGTGQKVLGLIWHVFSDELQVSLKSLQSLQLNICKGSKRVALQAIARIYDPLGIVVSPTVIKLKILFQTIWKRKLNWDETIPFDLLAEWNETIQGILQLSDMTIPRSALPMLGTNTTYIHIFADASLKAYGAVAYVKSINMQAEVNVSFLCARSRVAPLKENNEGELTLPKLELTANLIAARLCAYLKRTLKVKVQRFLLWSDSKIALNWIYGVNKQWKPYVHSRVTEIRSLTRLNDWGHCIGKENPADLITRGIPGSKLQKSSIWLRGPEWLERFQDDNNHLSYTEDPDVISQTVLLTEGALDVSKLHDPVLNYEDFSTWGRLLRTTAWVQRFFRVCHKKTKPSSIGLTAEELDSAENYWVRYVQNKVFPNEIRFLQKGQAVKGNSTIAELSPFLDDAGFLRLGGRLQLLEDTFDLKHPRILPADSRITMMLIDHYHLRTLHGGVGSVLKKLREKFWILRGRQLVKKLGKKCTTCQKLFGPSASQPFAPLPKERITLTRPFDNVGIDFTGPLYYTTNNTEVLQKSYLMIFTCAAVRAVHLELLTNMTTEGCLMGLRRFIARRGVPSTIFSDNAKTFRRAALELNEVGPLVDDEAVQGFLSQKRIKWHFIVERAPWWGGFWERLIRTIKNTLKAVIGKANLNFEQLRTFLAEAEAIVNDRPITYVSSDPLDMNPISPSKFLLNSYHARKEENVASTTNGDIQELWKNRFKYTNKMWKRWRVEYLQTLRLFHTNSTRSSITLKEGDVVLLFDNTRPRVHWKLAKIEKVFPGRDGRIRSCEIRCGDSKIFKRPIQLLYPLELGPAEGVEN